jgi:phytoene dehydrogenase-like protein
MSEGAFDVVVIGADADALVAAHTLARAGKRVCLVREYAAQPLQAGWVPPSVVSDLGLAANGYSVAEPDPWASIVLPEGEALDLTRDVGRTAEAIRHLNERDGAKWPEFCRRMHALAAMLADLYTAPPADPLTHELSGYVELGRSALRMRKLGREGINDLFRIVPMPVADLLDEWFENDALKAALAGAGVMNLAQGPHSGGTAYSFLHHHVGNPIGVFRQPMSNIGHVLGMLAGVDLCDAGVQRIDVTRGRVRAVVLENGDEIPCGIVISARDPASTLLALTDVAWLDPALVRAVKCVRTRGVAAAMTLTLDASADFSNLVIVASVDALERAYDDYKYGRVSLEPYIEARHVPPSAGERGRLAVHVQYVPYALRESAWDREHVQALATRVVQRLDEAAPGLGAAVAEWNLQTPVDLENMYGWPEGQPYHAEIALDQWLWMRPVPALARYRTPIEGLYLCGPAMHPGGGMPGAAGANAASIVVRDLKKR